MLFCLNKNLFKEAYAVFFAFFAFVLVFTILARVLFKTLNVSKQLSLISLTVDQTENLWKTLVSNEARCHYLLAWNFQQAVESHIFSMFQNDLDKLIAATAASDCARHR